MLLATAALWAPQEVCGSSATMVISFGRCRFEAIPRHKFGDYLALAVKL